MSWYRDWAIAHIQAHGIHGSGVEAVLAWEDAFVLLFTAEELHAATRDLLGMVNLKSFASEQRGAIINAVETARVWRRKQHEVQREQSPGCRRCNGSGWAIVPHPGLTDAGIKYHYLRSPAEDPTGLTRTMAVCCLCDIGGRTRRVTEEANRPATTFADYQNNYSDWQSIQDQRNAVVLAEFGTAHPTDVASLKAEIARRCEMPSREVATRINAPFSN